MIEIRPAAARGFADHGWLQSRHSFSFASYHDPDHVHFSALRVINEDWIAPGTGFGMHPHRDMEIITWVLEGAISHQDSIGHRSVIRPGQIQRMSAGTGITHSEHNRESVQTHMLQIWIVPARAGGRPSYQEGAVDTRSSSSGFCLAAAPEGQGGIVSIAQDARLWVGQLDAVQKSLLEFDPNRQIYVHLARGHASVNGVEIAAGDALKISGEHRLDIRSGSEAELLLFDLP